MRRLLSILVTGILASSAFAGIASAHHSEDHTQNHHGMCTAYFSGSENGQGNKRDNGNAFGVFEEGIGDRDDDGDVDAYDVADFCLEMEDGFGNPGDGNSPWFGDSECDEEGNGFESGNTCEDLENHPGGTGDGSNNGNASPPGQEE